MHTFNNNTLEAEDLCKFKASLVYIGNSRPGVGGGYIMRSCLKKDKDKFKVIINYIVSLRSFWDT